MSKTQLKKLRIEKFRALNGVNVDIADYITVVCGKNGTSKSSILGIAAQIFSFEKNYENGDDLSYYQITGDLFKSQYSEHFRISNIFDVPGSMKVSIELNDGYSDEFATGKLELMRRGQLPRPVVRNNSTAAGTTNTSRNFTHPVIYLSLKRLFPIAARTYRVNEFDYLLKHKREFIELTNELLNRNSSQATGTDGTVNSAVAHGDNYDQDSVSAGEDNAGQIILAILSFKKLKEEYRDYKGGLLLIDEADAGLFPTAQINLLKILDRECRDLNLQVVMTSHSPVLIEYAFEQSKKYQKRYKTIYLSNTFGDVEVKQDWSWPQISADINTRTVLASPGTKLPNVNVYFEDAEAEDFFSCLLYRQPIKKFTKPMIRISLGCGNYLNLIQNGIPEFSEKSIVCLDADVELTAKSIGYKTIVLLPGHLPPDQLIFEHLYNLPATDKFWSNSVQFTRDVFTNGAREVINAFGANGEKVDIATLVKAYKGKKPAREIFKFFYKNTDLKNLLSSGFKEGNPWRHWIESNPAKVNDFLDNLRDAMVHVMKKGYAVDLTKLSALEVKRRKN